MPTRGRSRSDIRDERRNRRRFNNDMRAVGVGVGYGAVTGDWGDSVAVAAIARQSGELYNALTNDDDADVC